MLSGVSASHREADAKSKDPYQLIGRCCSYRELLTNGVRWPGILRLACLSQAKGTTALRMTRSTLYCLALIFP